MLIFFAAVAFAANNYRPPVDRFPDRQPPREVLRCLETLEVEFFNYENQLTKGTLVVNRDVASDLKEIFLLIKKIHFPIASVIPVSEPKIDWSDEASMAADNTSAYNYRNVAGGSGLSFHALGRAIDINPKCNPFVFRENGELVIHPPGAKYDPRLPCSLSAENPAGKQIITAFLQRGWVWGGNWKSMKDYQHFEKKGPQGKEPPHCQ